ncbi:MAG TPA: N-acetyltransferase [Clostridiales bacterium UBA8960]|nr:N-acetyltransferase [Clostridiales bacterium UBA8960]
MELEFRKLRRQDAYEFVKWGRHEDPRFYQYNFPYTKKEEFDVWYYSKQKLLSKKVYGLFLEDYPLGFITLKNINWFSKRAELGVAVDPNHISEGFGTELIKRFLDYVFSHFPIDTMQLRVAHFNQRAQKSYEKIGFKFVKQIVEPFEEQSFRTMIIERYPEQFDLIGDLLFTTFYVMEIKKEDWNT